MTSSDSAVKLLIEYLHRVNVLAVAVELAEPRDENTELSLSADGAEIRLRIHSKEHTFGLPVRLDASHIEDIELWLPQRGRKARTSRYAVRANAESLAPGIDDEQLAPLPATSMSNASRLQCGDCSETLLDAGRVATWKDLPSEGWAEMMDLWHCHKPDDPDHGHGADEAKRGSSKGYAARSKLSAIGGIGFVDTSSFLLAEEDCSGVQVRQDNSTSDHALCAACGALVGRHDDQTGGIRLYKHLIKVFCKSHQCHAHTFDSNKWLSCFILSNHQGSGAARFYHAESNIDIWLFSPQTFALDGTMSKAEPCIKVYYRDSKDEHSNGDSERLTAGSLQLEELILPPMRTSNDVKAILERAHDLLPRGVNSIQDWKAAFIPRFSDQDLERATHADCP